MGDELRRYHRHVNKRLCENVPVLGEQRGKHQLDTLWEGGVDPHDFVKRGVDASIYEIIRGNGATVWNSIMKISYFYIHYFYWSSNHRNGWRLLLLDGCRETGYITCSSNLLVNPNSLDALLG